MQAKPANFDEHSVIILLKEESGCMVGMGKRQCHDRLRAFCNPLDCPRHFGRPGGVDIGGGGVGSPHEGHSVRGLLHRDVEVGAGACLGLCLGRRVLPGRYRGQMVL